MRNGLKVRWEQSRAGSSPAAHTKAHSYECFGAIFWFIRNKFFGSYLFLIFCRREYASGPNAFETSLSPSPRPGKFRYIRPVDSGCIPVQKVRTHCRLELSSAALLQIASMLSINGIDRSPNAVVSAAIRWTAPPNFQIEAKVISDGRFVRISVIIWMVLLSRFLRYVDFQ